MIITDFVRRGKSELYKTYLDEQFVCLLQAEIIVKHKLKKNMQISEQDFFVIREESEKITCKNDALSYVSKCLKTKKQVKDNLKQKGYLPNSIDYAIQFLESYGYLNDKYYAENFVKTKQNQKGKLYLKNALSQKGISSSVIEEILNDIQTDDNAILDLAKKYLKNKIIDQKTKEKLYRHLLSKGFEYSEVSKVVNIVLKGKNDGWD